MIKTGGKIEKNVIWILLIVIMLQLLVVMKFGFDKESYHLDEVYTQGLSNSYYKPFVSLSSDGMQWHGRDFYLDYLTVQKNEIFSFDSVYYNQSKDVHPPIYYDCIHFISSIFPNEFSKWFGICLNMVFLAGTVLLLYYLSKLILKDQYLALVICSAYGFSAGAISNSMLIRMYMMLTFFIVLSTLFHAIIVIKKEQKLTWIIGIMIANILGFLTQFLFIIYAAFLFLGYSIILVRAHRWPALIAYSAASLASAVICIALYPALVDVILGHQMSVDARTSFGMISDLAIRLIIFGEHVGKSLFGNAILFIVLLSSLFVFKMQRLLIQRDTELQILKIHKQYFIGFKRDEKIFFWLMCWVTLLAFIVITKIAPFGDGHRYIAYLYPNIVLVSVFTGYLTIRKKMDVKKAQKLLVGIICVVTLISYFSAGVDYLYLSRSEKATESMAKLSSYNAFCVADKQNDMTIAIPLLMVHEKSCFVSEKLTASKINMMQTKAGTEGEPIVVYFPKWVGEEQIETEVLKQILEKCSYSSYTLLYTKAQSGFATSIYLFE